MATSKLALLFCLGCVCNRASAFQPLGPHGTVRPCGFARHLALPLQLKQQHGGQIHGRFGLHIPSCHWNIRQPKFGTAARVLDAGRFGRRFSRLMCAPDNEMADPAEQVLVELCSEGIELEADLLESVATDARDLIVAALNPDNDPSWDEEAELSIVLCSDQYIQTLNSQWRGKDKATDVLSFPQEDGGSILGDLVISVPTALRQAAERSHDLNVEVRILMVHGLLHLLGYDHETSNEEMVEMADAEQRLMTRLGWQGDGLIQSNTISEE